MSKLILPHQQNAPPPGQVMCEANGELVLLAIQYPFPIGGTGAVLDVEAAREVGSKLLSEADKASTTRFQNRVAAEGLGATG